MASAPLIISHWYRLIEGLQASSQEFYASVDQAVTARQIPDLGKPTRVTWREGGLLSAKREYLRIQRREHIFDICGAPFGNGFFVSWWLGEPQGCLAGLAAVPFIGAFVGHAQTYYRIDTALMFQSAVHAAVLEVVDSLTTAKGLRALTEAERKPILREFFGR